MYTKRDRDVVAWVCGVGAANTYHVMRRFGIGRSQTYARLHQLVVGGLLREHRLLHGQPALYAATAEGLRWTGLLRLGVYRISAGTFEHTAQIAHVAAELHSQLAGWEVLSERTLRVVEADTGELVGSVKVGELPGGRSALHRPDLLLRSERSSVAVEVELTVKAPRRLQVICRGYARARHLDQVIYLANPQAARAVQRAAREGRAEDRITILALDAIEELAQRIRS